MSKEELPQELERILKQVKPQKPPKELINNYLSEVNAKIDARLSGSSFGIPQIGIALALGVVLAGAAYLYWMPQWHHEKQIENPVVLQEAKIESNALRETDAQVPEGIAASIARTALSAEDEAKILEAFAEEAADVEILDDDELFEELNLLDDLELSSPVSSAMPAGV